MAVDSAKLNRPGLGGSFGTRRTTGTSAQATRNLSGSSSAARTTQFSLKSKNAKGFVAGVGLKESKERYNQNYQGIRARLNAGQQVRSGGYSSDTYYSSLSSGGISNNYGFMQALMKGQMIGGTIMSGIQLLDTLGAFGGKNLVSLGDVPAPLTGSQQLDAGLSSLSGGTAATVGSSSASAAIANMQGCTDSSSLRDAITSAGDNLKSMEGQTATLQAESDEATKKLGELKQTKQSKQEAVKEKKQALSNAQNTLTAKENIRDTKKLELEKADKNYASKCEALTQAKANTATAQAAFNSAEQTLNNTPEEIPDGNGGMMHNPAYDVALQARDRAKQDLDAAKDAEETATRAKDDAFKALGDAKEAVKAAEKEYNDAEEAVQTAKKAEQDAEKALKTAEAELQQAEQNVSAAEGAIEKFKQHKQDVSELTSQIAHQKERLAKLEKEELEQFNKYNKNVNTNIEQANALAGKIDGDVDTGAERRLSNRIGRANDRAEAALNKRDAYAANVDKTYIANTLLKEAPETTINGQKFHQGTSPTGNQIYMIDSLQVTAEEYQARINAQ